MIEWGEDCFMKELRLIMIVFIIMMIILTPITILFKQITGIVVDYFSILTNVYCGLIVGLISSICQYYSSKNKIKNDIYNCYFDTYRTYFYCVNKSFVGHYNSITLFKKMSDNDLLIKANLDSYYGLIKRRDKLYYKLNPIIKFSDYPSLKEYKKSFINFFNKKDFEKAYGIIIEQIKQILISINEERFKQDEIEMIKTYMIITDK